MKVESATLAVVCSVVCSLFCYYVDFLSICIEKAEIRTIHKDSILLMQQ